MIPKYNDPTAILAVTPTRRASKIESKRAVFEKNKADAVDYLLPQGTKKATVTVNKGRFPRRGSTGAAVSSTVEKVATPTRDIVGSKPVKFQRRASTGMASNQYAGRTGSSIEKLSLKRKIAVRLNREKKAAISIQAFYRCYVASRNTVDIETTAALKVQSFFRTVVPRLQLRLLRMERKLEEIERRRISDLHAIENKLERDISKFVAKENKAAMKTDLTLARGAERKQLGRDIIDGLRKQNKKLRETKQELQQSIKKEIEIYKDQCAMQKVYEENMAILKERAAQVEETNRLARAAEKEHLMLIADYEEELTMRKQFCESESDVRRLYDKSLRKIVRSVRKSNEDADLVARVVSLKEAASR